ncbi:MAG: peptide ABC transporter ATP-binding protein [Deltaproteobacteria bacterium]|nr:MAG: peptide ABC transporter ATP-binding protein [Deltaproteobacteria bacterium]
MNTNAVPATTNKDRTQTNVLVQASGLTIHFPMQRRHLFAKQSYVHAVDNIDLNVPKGSAFGIVGESGSGKTTAALGMVRLTPITGGKILFKGQDITTLEGQALRKIRPYMQVVFQDPYSSLNPRLRAGEIVREPLERMRLFDKSEHLERVESLFDCVGLRREQMSLFPHQFSGGQRQRIGIARALASNPELLILDEPVSALDVAIQAQLLNLFRELKEKLALTYVFISHDLGVVQYLCDHIAVMYLGVLMETATRSALFKSPLHPYTKALLSSVPTIKGGLNPIQTKISGSAPPTAVNPAPGCRFASRCTEAMDICRKEMPQLQKMSPEHMVACHLFSNS